MAIMTELGAANKSLWAFWPRPGPIRKTLTNLQGFVSRAGDRVCLHPTTHQRKEAGHKSRRHESLVRHHYVECLVDRCRSAVCLSLSLSL